MDDPFDRARWPLSHPARELDDLAARTRPVQGHVEGAGVDWVVDHLLAGATPRELCEAALWVGLRRSRAEGRGPVGLVNHSVLAAAACAAIGDGDPLVAATAAAQLVAYTLGAYRGGVNDEREGPHLLGWYEPSDVHADAVAGFLDAALAGECELADHRWLAAAEHDPVAAEEALISAGAAGFHLNEHKLIHPAQSRAWIGADAPLDATLFRAAARYVGNHVQSPERAQSLRADAAALAVHAELGDEVDLRDGRDGVRTDHDRVSTVATGIARTAPRDLGPLLLGSLQDGLPPELLVRAVALVHASRYAATTFSGREPVGAIHACTGSNAVRRCLERVRSPEVRFQLAICSTQSPHAGELSSIEELAVPPSDDGALEDLLDALAEGDPDVASDAASAVPPEDAGSVAAAWQAVAAAAVTDQWMLLHGIKHVVAMKEDFEATDHPARIWFLAAAARTAAHAWAADQPVADEVRRRLG